MSTSEPPVSGSRPKGGEALRGLPSIAEARRKRQAFAPRMWTWGALAALAGLVAWWKIDAVKVESLRAGLLARQREVAARLGPKWLQLQTKVETWTAECAADKLAEKQAPGLVASWDFRPLAGIYLRLAKKDAASPEKLRVAAEKSLHDGFTSCLFTADNPSPTAGVACATTQDCAPGQICNEFEQCAPHAQPYNLRIAYRAMHVLTSEWIEDVQTIRSELMLRGTASTFDALEKYDLPVASELITQAKYFLVVVDEPPEGGEVEAVPDRAAGSSSAGSSQEDRAISSSPHAARVCFWRLGSDEKMFALRREAAGELLGGGLPEDEAARRARQRQANSCALALEVRQAVGAVGQK